jgi:hypothetical protein
MNAAATRRVRVNRGNPNEEEVMPKAQKKQPVHLSEQTAEHDTVERAEADLEQGKSASTAAGEFVREEIDHIREGKHGARSPKQAIAIGLSKARRAGVPLSTPKRGRVQESTRKAAERENEQGPKRTPPSPKRSRATTKALQREPQSSVSKRALSKQAKSAAKRRKKLGPATTPARGSTAARSGSKRKRSTTSVKSAATGVRREARRPAPNRTSRRWSAQVTSHSDALDLQADVFKRGPSAIARSLKRSAEQSKRRKSSPFRSAMSMLTFYENRAGKNLSMRNRRTLERAKSELRRLFDRE